MQLLALTLLLALAAPADEPVITKPSPEGVFRAVPEATLRAPRPLDVLHYDLSLTVNDSNAYIEGEVRMRLIPTRDLDRIVLDFTTARGAPRQGMETLAVEIGGAARTFVHDADSLVIDLPETVTPDDTLDVFVAFEGSPVRPVGVGYGWVRRFLRDENFVPDEDQPVLCTLSEPSGARTWWPCNDHPFDNATVTLTTTGPAEFRLAAPGHMTEDVDLGGGLRRQVADMTTPIPAYLVSVILTDQELWTESMTVDELLSDGSITQREMPLEYYAPQVLRSDAEHTWINTPEMITSFAQMFGPYPYADIKYGMALFVFGGAMEHATLSSMGDYTVSSETASNYPGPKHETIVAHELAHQWFGDAVHVGRWGDIWLNEGFARYCEALWLEEFYGPAYGKNWLDRIWRESYPGPLRDPDGLFSGTVYNKGAWVLWQLRQVMGRDELHQAMRNYVMDSELRFGPVFVEDFQEHCEAVYGESLDWYFTPWLTWAGRPSLDVHWAPNSSGAVLTISQPADRVYRLPLPVRVHREDGTTDDHVYWVGESGPVDRITVGGGTEITKVRVDTEGDWLLDQLVTQRAAGLGVIEPNPFTDSVELNFRVRMPSRVLVNIYDIRGRIVRALFNEDFVAGAYVRVWDGADSSGQRVASGVYLVNLVGQDVSQTRKITLVR